MSRKTLLLVALALPAVVCAGVAGYGATQPKTWRVERSARAAGVTPADVLPLIEDVEQWPRWAGGADAAGATYTFGETTRGPGASYTWTSPGSHGNLTLREVDATGVTYTMTMEDSETPARGSLRLAADGDATRITWTDEGDLSGMGPFGGLVVPMMEGSLGPHFDVALAALGDLARQRASERVAREAAAAQGAGEAVTPAGDPVAVDAPKP